MLDVLKRAFTVRSAASEGPPVGLHHFAREVDGRVVRYHLRVDEDGSGLVVANASSVARLSPSGVTIAHALLRGEPELAERRARRSFRGVSADRVRADVRRVGELLDEMTEPGGGHPLRSLEDPDGSVHRRSLSAPLSADVVVGDGETTRAVLERLWSIGVPQSVLIVRDVAAARQVVHLVEHAEDLGLIAGVRGRATELAARERLHDLAMAGLDHLDLFWAGPDTELHDSLFGAGDHDQAASAVDRCHELELCPVAVTPLLSPTLDRLEALGADLRQRRIGGLTLYALVDAQSRGGRVLTAGAVRQAAATAEEVADHEDLNLVWAAPVQRDPEVSLADQVRAGPRTAGEAAIRVEADGAVVAPTGPAESSGNLLRDDWRGIWGHACFERFRESVEDPDRCAACPGAMLCAAGCPAEPGTWARGEGGEG